MAVTDPIADMLTRVRNAIPHGELKVALHYRGEGDSAISGIKRVSKPGLRVYAGKGEIPRFYGGLGVAILSTSKGVMTGKQARTEGVGGEVLCHVW